MKAQVDFYYAGPILCILFDGEKTSAETKNVKAFFGNNGTDGDWTNFAPTVTLTNLEIIFSKYQPITKLETKYEDWFLKVFSADYFTVWFD